MPPTPRHKVFISYHDEDRAYKKKFVRMMGNRVIDKSVEVNDIDDSRIETQTIRRKIRDDFIADATVTIVLIGPCTWRRKHVDWEIGSSLRKNQKEFEMRSTRHPAAQPSRPWIRAVCPPR